MISSSVVELRVAGRLIVNCYRKNRHKDLETFIRMKLVGSRVEARKFFRALGVHYKTGKRCIDRLQSRQWIGFDGKYIFCRSWARLGYAKRRGGLYLCKNLKNLGVFLFVNALKTVTRWGVRARKRASAKPKDPSAGYYSTALNISQRTYFRKLRGAVKSKLIRLTKNVIKLGKDTEHAALRKNLPGLAMYRCGKSTVAPAPSTIEFLI